MFHFKSSMIPAAASEKAMRKIDILARYGGEECVCMLPETDLAEARQAGDRSLAPGYTPEHHQACRRCAVSGKSIRERTGCESAAHRACEGSWIEGDVCHPFFTACIQKQPLRKRLFFSEGRCESSLQAQAQRVHSCVVLKFSGARAPSVNLIRSMVVRVMIIFFLTISRHCSIFIFRAFAAYS